MAIVYHNVADIVAHLPEVMGVVRAEGIKVKQQAEALLAPHNHPGGHEVRGEFRAPDYLIHLEGRAPLSVEFGRKASATTGKGRMEGLFILTRAARL